MTTAFSFGPYSCSWSEAFFISRLSIAIVNLKPVVPGHVLVIPQRVVPRLQDLSKDEVADLWSTAHTLGPKLQEQFKAQALTFAIQDGAAAGQTVEHVHIHILPRRFGDFPRNDQVYDELEKTNFARESFSALDNTDDDRKPRTKDEMARESEELRELFSGISLPIPN